MGFTGPIYKLKGRCSTGLRDPCPSAAVEHFPNGGTAEKGILMCEWGGSVEERLPNGKNPLQTFTVLLLPGHGSSVTRNDPGL